jgi:two-component system chemotaxis response regulator CheB
MKKGIVVVGASLGGLKAIGTILGGLPRGFDIPIAVVQHRHVDSDSRLVHLLDATTELDVVEPDDKETIKRGKVYLCPSDYHLLVGDDELSLSVDDPVGCARPSIDVLFESAAEAHFDLVVGVLLTASSVDGAAGLAAIARVGGTTIVQDPNEAESPVAIAAAMARFKVDHVLALKDIARVLVDSFRGYSAVKISSSEKKRA